MGGEDLPPLAPLGDADDPISDEEWDDSDGVMLDAAGALDDDDAHPPPPPPEPLPEPLPGSPPESEKQGAPDPQSVANIGIATHDIQNGRRQNLESVCRAMDLMGNVDVAFLTEAKLTDDKCTRAAFGFEILATKAMSASRGGVALAYRNSKCWTVESIACHRPNVVSCVIVPGSQRTPLIGVCMPP